LRAAALGTLSAAEPHRNPHLRLIFSAAQSRYSSYVFAVRGGRDTDVRENDVRSISPFDARAATPDAPNSNVFAFDKALAMVRLAQIAQSRKSVDEAAAMMRSADDYVRKRAYATAPPTTCSTPSASGIDAWGHTGGISIEALTVTAGRRGHSAHMINSERKQQSMNSLG
jgi:hypothetical protein